MIGREVAGFRVEAMIGRGGMGRVYRAIQLDLGRPVALKVLSPDFADDADFRERFVRESRVAASIDHPNVLPIYDAGDANGLLYIAMRYVQGSDLRALIQREAPLSAQRSLALLRQAASALDAAHQRGLIHRDVKPANFLITEDHLYLTDFGIARELSASRGVTLANSFIGTLDYAAPEQIRHEAVDARTDLYALACVIFECLTGAPLFDRPTEHAVMQAHLSDPPPSLRALRPELPVAIDAVFSVALAKARDERYRTGRHFAQAFESSLAQPAEARAAPLAQRATVIASPPPFAAPSRPPVAAPADPAPTPKPDISLLTERTYRTPQHYRVHRDGAVTREPWNGSQLVVSVGEDDVVTALAEAGRYVRVRTSDGLEGWLAKGSLDPLRHATGRRGLMFGATVAVLVIAGYLGTTTGAIASVFDSVRAPFSTATPMPDASATLARRVQDAAREHGWRTHMVSMGDSVYGIADLENVSRSDLMSANRPFYPDIDSYTPPIGSVLLIPSTAPSSVSTPTSAPTFRPVTLQPQQVIMPPSEFPMTGYTVSLDQAHAPYGWDREFTSTTMEYYWVQFSVYIYPGSTKGTQILAQMSCDWTWTNFSPTRREISADVVGDGAKACLYSSFGPGYKDIVEYVTASRNVVVIVSATPRYIDDTTTTNRLVNLARQQLAIIDRVAPR